MCQLVILWYLIHISIERGARAAILKLLQKYPGLAPCLFTNKPNFGTCRLVLTSRDGGATRLSKTRPTSPRCFDHVSVQYTGWTEKTTMHRGSWVPSQSSHILKLLSIYC